MKTRTMRAVMVLGMAVWVLGRAASAPAALAPQDYVPYDIGPVIRGWEATPDRIQTPGEEELATGEAAAVAAVNASATDCITNTKIFLILNDYLGRYQATYFNLMGESPRSQIWVQANLAWPAGDPRPTPVITCEQVAYMMGQFDNNIHPKETAFFGMPDWHDGSTAYLPGLLGLPADYYYDVAGRQIVLVSNVRDTNYYDPTYPIYTAGFYAPSFEVYFDRNVMSIDAYDWPDRTGPGGSRPYLYEGVFAHEYQHLLHDDYDPDEENFVNEGMADLAMYLTGYGAATKNHVDAAAAYPENSLVVWGDQGDLEILADYGQAYLFQFYLMERLGRPFIQALFHNPENGISGVNSTLSALRKRLTFAELYHNWSVAGLIDSRAPGGGRYQFKGLTYNFDIGAAGAPNPEAYDTPGAPPWGTDFIWISGNPKELAKFTFNGLDYSTFPTGWSSDGSVLWGGTGDLIDTWAIFPAAGGGTLTFDTTYDIEAGWDFGFVQVSTDGGSTWTSLANASTTTDHDPNADPKVIANLPGLTGSSGGWVTLSFDLSAYAGQDVLLAFRYVTDWATTGAGWFIDNVYVDGTLISDGSSADPFQDITQLHPINNDFTVTFVGCKWTRRGPLYRVVKLKLDNITESGLLELDRLLRVSDAAAMLVTFDAPEGFTGYVDYTYGFTFTNRGRKE